jgi:hypothetical protein
VSKKSKDKPVVKVPKSKVGKAFFFGSQAALAVSVARSVRRANAEKDRLNQLHALLNAALLVVTVLTAIRDIRRSAERSAGAEPAEPLMLTTGK